MLNKKPIQTKTSYGTFLLVFVLVLISSGCIKDKINNLDNNIIYEPFFSLPVGVIGFGLDSLMGAPGFDTIPADTLLPDDSVFIFNGQRYEMPEEGYYDTVFTEAFSFADTEEWVNNVSFMMLRLNMENTIPSELLVQVSFLDENMTILFNIFDDPGLLVPAAEGNDPVIISPYDSDPLTDDEISTIPMVRYVQTRIAIRVRSSALGGIYDESNYFRTQLGFRVGLEIDTRE